MNFKTASLLIALSTLIVSNSFSQDDRNFWQRIFGKKSDDINVEQPQNSRDSLATLINDHLGTEPNPSTESDPAKVDDTTNSSGNGFKGNPQLTRTGKLEVSMNSSIETWLDTVKSVPTSGFRIQVFMGDLTEARRIRSALLSAGERASLDYNSSDYYVRIGDYRSLIEAEKKLLAIRKVYPSSYVVRDKIKL